MFPYRDENETDHTAFVTLGASSAEKPESHSDADAKERRLRREVSGTCPCDRRAGMSGAATYGFEPGTGGSPTLRIFAPTASSTRALRTRKRLGPLTGSARIPASNMPRTL